MSTCPVGSVTVWGAQGNIECQKSYPSYPLNSSAASFQTAAPPMTVESPMRPMWGHGAPLTAVKAQPAQAKPAQAQQK